MQRRTGDGMPNAKRIFGRKVRLLKQFYKNSDNSNVRSIRLRPEKLNMRSAPAIRKLRAGIENNIMESLILAQNERWRRVLSMQVERQADHLIF